MLLKSLASQWRWNVFINEFYPNRKLSSGDRDAFIEPGYCSFF